MSPERLLGLLREAVAGADDQFLDELHAAVWEAVTNAITHGATARPGLRVEVDHTASEVIVTVTDHGPGFAPPAGLLSERHRGLSIIGSYVTRVEFTRPTAGGTTVVLRKTLPRATGDLPPG